MMISLIYINICVLVKLGCMLQEDDSAEIEQSFDHDSVSLAYRAQDRNDDAAEAVSVDADETEVEQDGVVPCPAAAPTLSSLSWANRAQRQVRDRLSFLARDGH